MDSNDPRYIQAESVLSTLLRERTGYEISDLDRDATFMELGFDSLFLIQLSQQIKQRFKVKVSFRQLIEEITTINMLLPHLAAEQQSADAVPAPTTPAPTPVVDLAKDPQPSPVAQLPARPHPNHSFPILWQPIQWRAFQALHPSNQSYTCDDCHRSVTQPAVTMVTRLWCRWARSAASNKSSCNKIT